MPCKNGWKKPAWKRMYFAKADIKSIFLIFLLKQKGIPFHQQIFPRFLGVSMKTKLYLDITNLMQVEFLTGIQRVVREIAVRFLKDDRLEIE